VPKTCLVLVGVTAAAIAAAGAASAQQPERAKKRPQQTLDKGIDDAVPPGQETKIGERVVDGVRVVVGPGGAVIAHLDESFHDAVVATRNADGTIGYACLHGLPAATGTVKANASAKPKAAAPVLEEK
jgi:hypothetical protein